MNARRTAYAGLQGDQAIRGYRARFAMASVIALISAHASAQVPPDIGEQNRALGARIDVPSAIKTYGSVEEQPPYHEPGLIITRDLAYGDDPHYRLDVVAPRAAAAQSRPVVIFATGGDFTRKIDLPGGEPFYDNVVLWAAKHGLVGVNTERRHFRGRPWETGPQDMAAMIGWVHSHIAQYGGDPNRILFIGHAYGGTQLISYLAHPEFWCCTTPGIAAAAIISAPLNLPPATNPPPAPQPSPTPAAGSVAGREPANQGPNPLFDPEHSDLEGLANLNIPILIGSPEFDGAQQKQSAMVLQQRLCAAGHCPATREFPSHNHLSVMFSFNTPDDSVSGPLLDWTRGVLAIKN